MHNIDIWSGLKAFWCFSGSGCPYSIERIIGTSGADTISAGTPAVIGGPVGLTFTRSGTAFTAGSAVGMDRFSYITDNNVLWVGGAYPANDNGCFEVSKAA